jgi:hypothetical protein
MRSGVGWKSEESPLGLRLLVDEDLQAKALVGMLRSAGHNVVTVTEAGLGATPDTDVLASARVEDRVLLTRNARDFRGIHEVDCDHAGILAVFQDRDPSKNMTLAGIVRSVANLEHAEMELAGQFVVLNAWNY